MSCSTTMTDQNVTTVTSRYETLQSACAALCDNMVGRLAPITTPYGTVPLCYYDWVASGRHVAGIERCLTTEVLPLYANSHTTTSITGLQSTSYLHESRRMVGEYFNAHLGIAIAAADGGSATASSEDCVIFAGNGTTGAVYKLVQALGLGAPLPRGTPRHRRPAVVFGPWEHHSNMLPWIESGADVVQIRDTAWSKRFGSGGSGSRASGVDLEHLEASLKKFKGRPLVVGAFSAASNISGVIADDNAITALLHSYGALAVWDCATAAPHMRVDMHPLVEGPNRDLVYKDAIFMSGHKFVGGPGSPGVLVCRRQLLRYAGAPTAPGGGTVLYVSPHDRVYLDEEEEREEAGSPDVEGVARLGLAVRLQQRLCALGVQAAEQVMTRHVLDSLRANSAIVVLGDACCSTSSSTCASSHEARRLPIFSFLIRYTAPDLQQGEQKRAPLLDCTQPLAPRHGLEGRQKQSAPPLYLHHNFVCALLNDLFGVQSRGGCMCAGPFAMRLLGMDTRAVEGLKGQLRSGNGFIKPGFTRFSVSTANTRAEVDHILSAVHFVAKHGAAFMHQYLCDSDTAVWRHASEVPHGQKLRRLINLDPLKASTSSSITSLLSSTTSDISTLSYGTVNATTSTSSSGGSSSSHCAVAATEKGLLLQVHKRAENEATAALVSFSSGRYADGAAVWSMPPDAEALRWAAYPWEGLPRLQVLSEAKHAMMPGCAGGAHKRAEVPRCVVLQPERYFHPADAQGLAALGWGDIPNPTNCRNRRDRWQLKQLLHKIGFKYNSM